MNTLIIHGSPGSGKTRAGRLLAVGSKFVYLDGRIKFDNFFFSSCDKDTKTIIIDDIKNKSDLMYFRSLVDEGNIVVNKQSKSPFEIKIDKLILICDFL